MPSALHPDLLWQLRLALVRAHVLVIGAPAGNLDPRGQRRIHGQSYRGSIASSRRGTKARREAAYLTAMAAHTGKGRTDGAGCCISTPNFAVCGHPHATQAARWPHAASDRLSDAMFEHLQTRLRHRCVMACIQYPFDDSCVALCLRTVGDEEFAALIPQTARQRVRSRPQPCTGL